MKVLCFTHLYPKSELPGRGIFNARVFEAIARCYDVRVVVPEPWWARGRSGLASVSRDRFMGIETYYHRYWAWPHMLSLRAADMLRGVRNTVGRIRGEFPFDVILASWAYPDGAAAAELAREFSCPLVMNVLGSDINTLPEYPALRKQIRSALLQSTRIVTVSHALADRVVDLDVPRGQVVAQHNGVDGQRFCIRDRRQARRQLGLPERGPLIGYVGRLSPEKGVDVLLKAVQALRASSLPDVKVVLVGTGPDEAALKRMAKVLGIEPGALFMGSRLPSEIPDWIAAADALCLPSRREGCPNVVLEALASGVPVVATRVGGLPELIREDNGFLVAPDSAAELGVGLLRALKASWQPDVLRASVPYLSWDEVGERYARILAEAVAEKQGCAPARPEAVPLNG